MTSYLSPQFKYATFYVFICIRWLFLHPTELLTSWLSQITNKANSTCSVSKMVGWICYDATLTIWFFFCICQWKLCVNACLPLPRASLFFLVSMSQSVMPMGILRRYSATRDTAFVLMTEESQISPPCQDLCLSAQVSEQS